MQDPGWKVGLTLVPPQVLASIRQRYLLGSSSASNKATNTSIPAGNTTTSGRRLLQTSPIPSPAAYFSNWTGFMSYDDDYSIEPALVAAPTPQVPASNSANLTVSQQSVGGFVFDLLQPDAGYDLQDALPKETGIYAFSGGGCYC